MRATIVALAAIAAGLAFAQMDRAVDQTFVRDAAHANHFMLELCQLAEQKAMTSQAQNLAEQIMDDHEQLGDQLRSTVGSAATGVRTPPMRSSEDQATFERLASLQGTMFDAAWADVMRTQHDRLIALYQDQARRGSDMKLRRFAETTLPSEKRHRQMLDPNNFESR
jgi:putative membrane protein